MFTLSVLIPLLTAGTLTRFLAGLFGIGGGLLIVPIVLWLLETQHHYEIGRASCRERV